MYFDKPGKEHLEETLRLAKKEALLRGIGHLVVASTGGETGLRAAKLLKDSGIKLIIVSHNTGFKEKDLQEIDPEAKKEIESLGGVVLTGTMVLRGLGSAIKVKTGYSEEQIVADTLRMLGQGTKVCVEIVAMAADAGLIPFKEVISVAGTARGADTAAIIEANSSNHFFEIRVKEFLAKPRNF